MALLAIVDGVKVYMYPNDHAPVHFHAILAEHRAVFDLETLVITRGTLPRPKARAIAEWASSRQPQLLDAWARTQAGLPVGRVK